MHIPAKTSQSLTTVISSKVKIESSRNLKFKRRPRASNTKSYTQPYTKLGHKGMLPRARDLLLNFETPGEAEAANLKFASRLSVRDIEQKL